MSGRWPFRDSASDITAQVERKAQINVRMTADEKQMIEEAARERGFAGISEYIRASALREQNRRVIEQGDWPIMYGRLRKLVRMIEAKVQAAIAAGSMKRGNTKNLN